ncbi:hypothetical protein [Aeromicrobium wangtongii]|uniref:Uncharacterized protein n=1 Tax=Aeromicrobium wangtongii TaxID=2969247 RepID=A0ABY5M330_9ACTN|nr:hypothetical protein [Aeromicrobium wangtongii]MCD9198580.1 hypothetical protein [Aeromicrobium wangtongii]UUP12605.1 hypothetical protein NQV15_12150 [Aeromicrobium wangtongii]
MTTSVVAALAISQPWETTSPTASGKDTTSVPPMRPSLVPDKTRSVSVDFATVVDPDTNWSQVAGRLDEAGANAVELNAGRIEFTAFDWKAHPAAAAEPGTDHLARAARDLHRAADGSNRQVGLIVDAMAPNWLADHPRAAGVSIDGRRAVYQASASQLVHGEVGRRLVDFVGALCERYDPAQISITELFLNGYTFGSDDRRLFKQMTGRSDWPRTSDGSINEEASSIKAWRAAVIADLLGRMRKRMDATRDGAGSRVGLAMDVRINWKHPARGDLISGHDYAVLLGQFERLILWAYLYRTHRSKDLEQVLDRLEQTGLDMSRLTVSVGVWDRPPGPRVRPISTSRFVAALRAAETHGITSVNVTPLSLMSDPYWKALASVWNPDGT